MIIISTRSRPRGDCDHTAVAKLDDSSDRAENGYDARH